MKTTEPKKHSTITPIDTPEPEPKRIIVKTIHDIPAKFTGIMETTKGDKAWFRNGRFHRADGPAIEFANGEISYWIDGIETYKEAIEVYSSLFPEEKPL